MTETLTELILDRAHNAVISMDEQGRVTYWNPSAERVFGISQEEALGRTVGDLVVPPHLRAQHEQGLARFLAKGTGKILDRRVELIALRADGTEFPVELTSGRCDCGAPASLRGGRWCRRGRPRSLRGSRP